MGVAFASVLVCRSELRCSVEAPGVFVTIYGEDATGQVSELASANTDAGGRSTGCSIPREITR
jgi:hypothetical protein